MASWALDRLAGNGVNQLLVVDGQPGKGPGRVPGTTEPLRMVT